MIKLLIRLVINAVALWLAALIVDGISLDGSVFQVLFVALIFGLINALIKPLLKLISAPLIIFTLGLFTLLINAFLLWFTSLLTDVLTVDGFWAALLGALIVSLVSWVLSMFLDD